MYFNFQLLMLVVKMVLFVWLVVMKEQWRSVIVECGALSAMRAGTAIVLQWSVNNWDSREQVG